MINVVTLDMDELTVQLIKDGTVLIWTDGDTTKEADVSVTLTDLRRVIQAAELMGKS
jgi:hypothetical protein